jgi:hypothetical protein
MKVYCCIINHSQYIRVPMSLAFTVKGSLGRMSMTILAIPRPYSLLCVFNVTLPCTRRRQFFLRWYVTWKNLLNSFLPPGASMQVEKRSVHFVLWDVTDGLKPAYFFFSNICRVWISWLWQARDGVSRDPGRPRGPDANLCTYYHCCAWVCQNILPARISTI